MPGPAVRHILRYKVPAAAAAAWTPASLTGLVAWYKADVGVTTSGGNVTAVADQSGNGYDLTNASTTVAYNATGLNGLPTFEYTVGAAGFLRSSVDAVGLTGATGSAFVVAQIRSPSNDGHVVSYLGNGQAVEYNNAASAAWLLRDGTNNSVKAYRNNGLLTTGAISLATNYRLGVIFDGSFCQIYINNSVQASPVACTDSFTQLGTLYFGSAPSGGPLDGFISEIVITSSSMSSGDRSSLDSYLQTRWSL